MIDPARHRQLEELDQVELCVKIWTMARNELYLNMRYLDVSLSSLGFEADWGRGGIATDGFLIHYDPPFLLALYRQGRVLVDRAFLHMLLHCLFGHPDNRKGRALSLRYRHRVHTGRDADQMCPKAPVHVPAGDLSAAEKCGADRAERRRDLQEAPGAGL